MHDDSDILVAIAKASIDVRALLAPEYGDELADAFSFAGKYLLIASLPPDDRRRVKTVSNPTMCSLCHAYRSNDCELCVLRGPVRGYCGSRYSQLIERLIQGDIRSALEVVVDKVSTLLRRLRG